MAEADARWQEHYSGVFGGDIVDISHVREPPRDPALFSCTLEVGPVATESLLLHWEMAKGLDWTRSPLKF